MVSKKTDLAVSPARIWPCVDTVLLDMDGTLLDKYFDDYFWEEYVPSVYAAQNGLSDDQAREALLNRYRSVESTLQWTDLDYWSTQLDLDIPELKRRIDHLIVVHPYVIDFLNFLRQQGKEVHLVTAAHNKTLAIKMEKTALAGFFNSIVCSEDIGLPKESVDFWPRLEARLGFDPTRTMLADDTVKVLRAARNHGVKHLIFVARPSSRQAARPSEEFASISYFKELII